MRYWIVKNPFKTRKWKDILIKGNFKLYGIRNHQAKNNISQMKKDDIVLFYNSNENKSIIGTMKVINEAYQDNTSNEKWFSIDFKPTKTFEKPLKLEDIKRCVELKEIALIKQPRLSVFEIEEDEYKIINDVISTLLNDHI